MKPSKTQETKPTIRCSAKLSATALNLPVKASVKLPSRGMVTVEGIVNYIPFRAVLVPDGNGSHRLKVTKAMRLAFNADTGDTVTMEITRVADEPETRVPVDLRKALTADPQANASWMDITPLARRDWIFSICTAKQAQTRERRVEKTRDMLAGGKRRLCCFPGIKWMMKENAAACGMWLPLPN